MSIIFATAQCIHLGELALFFEKSHIPEREVEYDRKLCLLRVSALVLIGLLCFALLSIVSLEVYLYIKLDAELSEQARSDIWE